MMLILLFCYFRAARATKEGHFNAEIIPVTVQVTDKNGDEKTITVRLVVYFISIFLQLKLAFKFLFLQFFIIIISLSVQKPYYDSKFRGVRAKMV